MTIIHLAALSDGLTLRKYAPLAPYPHAASQIFRNDGADAYPAPPMSPLIDQNYVAPALLQVIFIALCVAQYIYFKRLQVGQQVRRAVCPYIVRAISTNF
jgi:hypothetical protein